MALPSPIFRQSNRGKTYEDVITELEARIRELETRLILLEPNPKYPALREAYLHYKLIEKLTLIDET